MFLMILWIQAQMGCLAVGWGRAGLSAGSKTQTYQKTIRNKGKKKSVTRIKGAKSLPPWGKGYTTYSWLGSGIGRQYGHHKVIDTLHAAFASLSKTSKTTYVVAEIGWPDGRPLEGHTSHKNGMKVDILTPMRHVKTREPRQLPSHIFNLWGYCWSISPKTHRVVGTEWEIQPEYISSKRLLKKASKKRCPTTKQDLKMEVDFDAIRDLIVAVRKEAPKHGLVLSSVIIDQSFIPKVGKTGAVLTPKAWIRHDEHLHFSFRHR
ncbi:MAG: penicillin-insensitive murein endopeptidase [Myxococcota bacterium]|nr:penicillin-insensitive murein endopeptidase [Myxococcota bacterium]